MNPLKKLASQTAIYGLPTIVGRLLNYFLTPLYTYNFSTAEFGVVTSAYAYVSFLLVFLTYGMETTVFKFSQSETSKQKVFTTALISVFISSASFIIFASTFSQSIAETLKFTGHPEYVVWFAIIIGTDALTAIPFAKLREQGKAKRFALIKTINILVNIGLNLFFIVYCKNAYQANPVAENGLLTTVYNPQIGVGYIFISNLIASLVTLVLLFPEIFKTKYVFETELWKRMMRYALPLLIAGLAGMINETLDRVLLTHLLPEKDALAQTGIYGACYKVSIIMTIFIQTFRFAAEPFFFSHSAEKDAKKTYATIMKYFVIVCAIIFLATMVNISWIQYFVGKDFREGMNVVPVLLMANLFLGIFINQSIWYKLTSQTHYGAFLTIFGAIITITLNLLWIPRFGYMGSAWATLICYASMMVLSYFMGNKHYPVNYDLKRIFMYLGLSVTLYALNVLLTTSVTTLNLLIGNGMVLAFLFFVWKMEKNNLLVRTKK